MFFFENPVTRDHIVVCLKTFSCLTLHITMKSNSSRQFGHGGLNSVLDSACITLHSAVHSMLPVIRKLISSDGVHSVTSTILHWAGSCMISMSSNLQGLMVQSLASRIAVHSFHPFRRESGACEPVGGARHRQLVPPHAASFGSSVPARANVDEFVSVPLPYGKVSNSDERNFVRASGQGE